MNTQCAHFRVNLSFPLSAGMILCLPGRSPTVTHGRTDPVTADSRRDIFCVGAVTFADECGFDLGRWPNVAAWAALLQALLGFARPFGLLPMHDALLSSHVCTQGPSKYGSKCRGLMRDASRLSSVSCASEKSPFIQGIHLTWIIPQGKSGSTSSTSSMNGRNWRPTRATRSMFRGLCLAPSARQQETLCGGANASTTMA